MGSEDALFCIPDESGRNGLESCSSQGSIPGGGIIGQAGQGKMRAYLKASTGAYGATQPRQSSARVGIKP
jgi:hypothetical protein